MKVTTHTKPFHYITIENLWSDKERKEMFDEIIMFEKKGIFLEPQNTNTATDISNKPLKKNTGKFFDDIWLDRNASSVLKHNTKLFDVFKSDEVKQSWYFKNLLFNSYSTLVSYYEDSDFYKSHIDNFVVTALSWFFIEPKKFNGGEIIFSDYNLKFEVTNNLTIVFPSSINHEVSKISLKKEDRDKGLGRFCMNQFLYHTNYG